MEVFMRSSRSSIGIAGDSIGLEVMPWQQEKAFLPVHAYMFSTAGAQIMEVMWLEEIAREKVYEFAFIGAALKLRGATGSPFLSVIILAVMPQVMPRFIGFSAYQLDSNLRNSALVGLTTDEGIVRLDHVCLETARMGKQVRLALEFSVNRELQASVRQRKFALGLPLYETLLQSVQSFHRSLYLRL